MKFVKQKLTKKLYSINKVRSIIKQMQFINRKKFVAAVLNLDKKAFVIYVAY